MLWVVIYNSTCNNFNMTTICVMLSFVHNGFEYLFVFNVNIMSLANHHSKMFSRYLIKYKFDLFVNFNIFDILSDLRWIHSPHELNLCYKSQRFFKYLYKKNLRKKPNHFEIIWLFLIKVRWWWEHILLVFEGSELLFCIQ